MTVNVGFADRFIRLAIAGVLFSFLYFATGPLRYVAFLGFIPFFTGLIGWCPIYSLFGFRTCPAR